jgi:hypothetical protein
VHMCRDSFNIIVIPANGLVQTSMFNSCDEKDKNPASIHIQRKVGIFMVAIV